MARLRSVLKICLSTFITAAVLSLVLFPGSAFASAPAVPVFDSVPASMNGKINNLTSVTLSWTGPSGAGFMCSIDGKAAALCPNYKTMSGLKEGAHSLAVRSSKSGLYSAYAKVSWTTDLTPPPVPVINTKPVLRTNNNTAAFTWTASDSAASYCQLGTGLIEPCIASYITVDLTSGLHTFNLYSEDAYGNRSSASYTWEISPTNFLIIKSAPALLAANGQKWSNSSTAEFTWADWTGHDNQIASAECRLDASTNWSSCGSNALSSSVSGLSEGSHTLEFRAINEIGNAGESQTYTWLVDTIAPVVPDYYNVIDYSKTSSHSVNFHAESTVSSRAICSKAKTPALATDWSACDIVGTDTSRVYNYTGLADQVGGTSYDLWVKVVDPAGNASVPAHQTIIMDSKAPAAPAVTGIPAAFTKTKTASLAWGITSTDSTINSSNRGYQCSADGGLSYKACPDMSSLDLSSGTWGAHSWACNSGCLLTDQKYSLWVTQLDLAGNVSAPTKAEWTVDNIAPSAPSMNTVPAAFSNTATPSVVWTAEPSAASTCSLDGVAYAACASPKSLSGIKAGTHSFAVKQTDLAGNVSSAATTSWATDLTAPVAPALTCTPACSGTALYTKLTTVGASWAAPESGATITCQVDGAGDFATCSSSKTLSALVDGRHSLIVRFADKSGNSSQSTATWTVDTTAPSAPVLSGAPSGSTTANSATIAFTIEPKAIFVCSVDGGAYAACVNPVARTGLSIGAHSFAVKQTDLAGNVSSVASVNWTVYAVALPRLGAAEVQLDGTTTVVVSNQSDGYSLSCSIDGGSWGDCSSPVNLGVLSSGIHKLAARQYLGSVVGGARAMVVSVAPDTTVAGSSSREALITTADSLISRGYYNEHGFLGDTISSISSVALASYINANNHSSITAVSNSVSAAVACSNAKGVCAPGKLAVATKIYMGPVMAGANGAVTLCSVSTGAQAYCMIIDMRASATKPISFGMGTTIPAANTAAASNTGW